MSRYGRFVADPTAEELEKFFFLDGAALERAQGKRWPHNRLGWSIQWGTVRMLGTFLTDSGLAGVPEVVIRYVAGQLGIGNWTSVKLYGDRQQTPYEHAWEIRDLLGYRVFPGAEAEVAAFIASRVAKTRDSRRDLFDRAARKPGLEHIKGFEDLVAGSWRRLVFGNPKLEPPQTPGCSC